MNKKVLLMILDGWGEGTQDKSNAIFTQGAPYIEGLKTRYPHSLLKASGEDVGLPEGQMGNSEVGHLNIGAGRIVFQDLVKINIACREHRLLENQEIARAYAHVKQTGKKLHFMGLCSQGGVHSSLEHLYEFLDCAAAEGLEKVFVHCFMDGRDCDPKSGAGFIEELDRHCASTGAKIASIIGRFYAMDRDNRWERVKLAYDLLVKGEGEKFTSATEVVKNSYEQGLTDEFMLPHCAVDSENKAFGNIEDGDAVIFFNFRNDRARELTSVLTQEAKEEFDMQPLKLHFCSLTPYDDKFKDVHILFDKENVKDSLGEVVAKAGMRQLRIAETEKYAHVTFFFSGGRETVFENENRILINSPKVATYDLQPEMSAELIAQNLIDEISKNDYELIILNFANGDMVGHTGIYDAICKAIQTVDQCSSKVIEAAKELGYTILVTADHGNADFAINADGSPNTAHTVNPVPLIVVDENIKEIKDGKLADIAPTILSILDIPIPEQMNGKSLI